MTTHNYEEHYLDYALVGLEPGEYNPLEHEPVYNPLQYCYPVVAMIEDDDEGIHYELAIKFQLQEHGETTPIDFIDPKTGKPHSIDFFPKVPDLALEPVIDGPEPNLDEGYQIGENKYYLVPIVCRCKHIESGRLLTREATRHLIGPEVLQAAILAYRDKVAEDLNAPHALFELLNTWDPTNDCLFADDEDDPWNAPYHDEEDEYDV